MERLRILREKKGVTQKEVARLLGVDRTTYVKYETGASEPNFDALMKLSAYFEVSADYLISNSNYSQQPFGVGQKELTAMFGDRLKLLRRSKGVTQEQLASIIGVERSSVGKYEGKSKIVPSVDIVKKIAEYFGVSTDYLLERTDSPSPLSLDKKAALMLRIKELRARDKMSQQMLADKMNVARSSVAMWERGTEPGSEALEKLADIFNVSIDYLVGRTAMPTADSESPSLDAQLSEVDFALSGELHDLSDEEKRDILDYVRFKRSQKKAR